MQKKDKKHKRSVEDEVAAERSLPHQGEPEGEQAQGANHNSSLALTDKGRWFRRGVEKKVKEETKKQQLEELQQPEEEEFVEEEDCYEVPELHCTYRRPRGGYYGGEDGGTRVANWDGGSGRTGRPVADGRDRNNDDNYDRDELSEILQLLRSGRGRDFPLQASGGDRNRNSAAYRNSVGEDLEIENLPVYKKSRYAKSSRNKWTNDRDLQRGYPRRTYAEEDFDSVDREAWLANSADGPESLRNGGIYRTRTGSRGGASAETARSAGRARNDLVPRKLSSGKAASSGFSKDFLASGPSNSYSFDDEYNNFDHGAFEDARFAVKGLKGGSEDAESQDVEERGRANPRFRRYAAQGPEEKHCETRMRLVCPKSVQKSGGRVRSRRDIGKKIGKLSVTLYRYVC